MLILVAPMTGLYLPFVDWTEDTAVDAAANVPLWVYLLAAAIPMIYFFLCWSLFSRSIGQAVFGIKIVNYVDGRRINPAQAALRSSAVWLGVLVSNAVPPLGFLAALLPTVLVSAVFDPIRRGLHDKAAGTIVVRT